MTKPIWAISGVELADPNDPSCAKYALTFNGAEAGTLTVQYAYNGCTTAIRFNIDHEGNDGAWVMSRALNALYENYDLQNERIGGGFTFPYEAFLFLEAPLTFSY